jgi:tricorn protease
VNIKIGLADSEPSTQIKHYNDNISEIALSPNGKEFAFVVRGDIYVASADQGETKRITNTAAQERSVSFSPDGRRLLFAGEYKNRWGLYEAAIAQANEPYFFNSTLIDVHPILENEEENFQPKYSPDGRDVAYLENRSTLKVINLDSKQARLLVPGDVNYSYEDGDQWFDWSPDGKWLVCMFLNKERWSPEVGLVSADGKQGVINLTKSGYQNENGAPTANRCSGAQIGMDCTARILTAILRRTFTRCFLRKTRSTGRSCRKPNTKS